MNLDAQLTQFNRKVLPRFEPCRILQPLLVVKRDKKIFELIAGERRLRAAIMAQLTTIPVIVFTNTDTLVLALLENIQREDLTPLEEDVLLKIK